LAVPPFGIVKMVVTHLFDPCMIRIWAVVGTAWLGIELATLAAGPLAVLRPTPRRTGFAFSAAVRSR
jgi:hypothetical protein